MAGPLNWTSEALEDIDAIAEFIARDSPRHARRIIEALFELGNVIEVHPFAGRVVPEVGRTSLRERFLYSYRVIYEIRADQIAVLAVLHGRRLLDSVDERLGG
ncbi:MULTISPECIES: type II toxin-antitoxin system RelE/ParE family toxin [Stenotrophomonas]|uniref:type II toxin-antitoxin system RelE/ParE family toxin n=1 Tax=Stenotrophomonas TaxID=40323 RepID=UPI001AEBE60F|nr:type II toxin-antitoxin system RelE/ParE family toxin [Stenotrophomonas rhizophila]